MPSLFSQCMLSAATVAALLPGRRPLPVADLAVPGQPAASPTGSRFASAAEDSSLVAMKRGFFIAAPDSLRLRRRTSSRTSGWSGTARCRLRPGPSDGNSAALPLRGQVRGAPARPAAQPGGIARPDRRAAIRRSRTSARKLAAIDAEFDRELDSDPHAGAAQAARRTYGNKCRTAAPRRRRPPKPVSDDQITYMLRDAPGPDVLWDVVIPFRLDYADPDLQAGRRAAGEGAGPAQGSAGTRSWS